MKVQAAEVAAEIVKVTVPVATVITNPLAGEVNVASTVLPTLSRNCIFAEAPDRLTGTLLASSHCTEAV